MVAYEKGIDLSNYSGPVTVEEFRALIAAGYTWCILGTQTGSDGICYTAAQMANALTAGMRVAAVYCFVYWTQHDEAELAHALSYGLPVWLDCEYDVAGRSASQICELIRNYVAQLGPQCAGIYTGQWWWPNTGDTAEFAYLPLWVAGYVSYVPADFSAFVPFGGWQQPQIMQYSDQGACDVNADLNLALIVAEEDAMIRHNGTSAWYDQPEHQSINGQAGCNAQLDFNLPPGTASIEVEIYLQPGSAPVQLLDGDGNYAFQVGWDGGRYGCGMVKLADGWFSLQGSGVLIQRVGCLACQ